VGATVIHPGAAYPARRWPAQRWAAVARALAPDVVITGGAKERELALSVARDAGIDSARVVGGHTDLLQLAAIVSKAALVISGDTGIAHLATALRTPSVILFGPTAPARWGPPADRPWHHVLWKGQIGDPNAMTPDRGLLAIQVEEVLQAVHRFTLTGVDEQNRNPTTNVDRAQPDRRGALRLPRAREYRHSAGLADGNPVDGDWQTASRRT
jgi:ADP-heptose:LPS heptosyltransferase